MSPAVALAHSSDSPEQLVAIAPELEALPAAAQRAMVLLQDRDTTLAQMAEVLGTDQAMTSAVLRQANSARSMPNRRIASIHEAVARIGLRALWEVVVRASASPMLDRGLPAYALSRRTAWRHAATASRAARLLALRLAIGRAEEAAVAGLLHDIGKMVLNATAPEAIARAVALARARGLAMWEAERVVFGFDHGLVGEALMRRWGLPEVLVDAVGHHHQIRSATTRLAALVHVADAFAHQVGAVGGAGSLASPEIDPAAYQVLATTAEALEDLLENLRCVEEVDL